MSAAELVAVTEELVCKRSVFEGPHCHCDDFEGATPACSGPEKKALHAEVTESNIDKFLIAVEDSLTSLKAVSYVSQILRGRRDVQVRLLHVLPPIPPGLLEFGGAEHPQIEQRLGTELRQSQAQWIETQKRKAQASLDNALTVLIQGGLSSYNISTSFSSPIHRPDVAHEILKAAEAWKCGTLIVGRHTRSWIQEIRSTHVGDDLVRKGQGFAIWVVE
jgi:nucleotide-binding universal stress UspA family protein